MVDLPGQYKHIKETVDNSIQEVLNSAAYINGPFVKEFQADLEKYLGAKKYSEIDTELAERFGGRATRKTQILNLQRAPSKLVAKYAIPDAELTLDLWLDQEEKIKSRKLERVVEFERRLMPTLIRTEARGIRIDVEYAQEAKDKLEIVVSDEKKKLFKLAGKEFNPNSPKEVRSLFEITQEGEDFFAKDGTKLDKTGSGQPSLGKPVLSKMSDPVAKQLIYYRSLLKTKDTFLANHVLGSVIGDRVYPNINQMKGEDGGTGTGRLSYTSPALQQIPSRNGEVSKIIKPCFLPEEGQLWLESDMNSFEVRVFAHLVSKINPQMMYAYRDNPKLDFHQWAADLAGITRSQGKTLNLAMLYRQGKGASAELMGLPWEWAEFENKKGEVIRYKKAGYEAEEIIATYHDNIKGVRELGQKAEELATKRGFVQTAHGRRLRFPKGYKAYKASAVLCQATAADENKENWLKIEEALGNDGTLLLNTHDSYSMSVDENWRPIWERVQKAVEKQTLNVPLILDLEGVGKNWAEAKGLV